MKILPTHSNSSQLQFKTACHACTMYPCGTRGCSPNLFLISHHSGGVEDTIVRQTQSFL